VKERKRERVRKREMRRRGMRVAKGKKRLRTHLLLLYQTPSISNPISSSSSTDSMNIFGNVHWRIVRDYMSDVRKIDTSRDEI